MSQPIYIIGIDLGTTNSVVAYTPAQLIKGQAPDIQVFEIPQLVDAGVVENRKILPSCILVPREHEIEEDNLKLPWEGPAGMAVGEFARQRGAQLPLRLISSAKSWLCHPLVDRNKPILPWHNSGDDDPKAIKLSPIAAQSAILEHIRNAWDHVMAKKDKKLKFKHQEILLTVPASFDAVARDLTVKAAQEAGLENITLLEEPQAAFYAWIEANPDWREQIKTGDHVLICDVGGGTSDFSLISVTESQGELTLERVAVGDHLLVGGDNMDLALAHAVMSKSKSKKKLNARQMQSLWHSCRSAKEKLLNHPELESLDITILGSGSKLIGGSRKVKLPRNLIKEVIINGFLPESPLDVNPKVNQQVGIREHGLAYEAEPAITRHLAYFLKHKDKSTWPTTIFFNGGVMKSSLVRKQVMDVVSSWNNSALREIENTDFDLSVAMGAVYYGLARRGNGVRIRSGLGKTYYIGVAASLPAVPGMDTPLKALCVAPFGMEEGTDVTIPNREFILVVGEDVKFDFLGSSIRLDDSVGLIIDDWEDQIEHLTSLETILDGETGSTQPVFLEVKVTEIGTLEIWCKAREDERRWKLEFNVRETSQSGT